MKPVCIVTGAAGRLGSALCARLAASHHVIAVYHRHIPAIDSQLTRRVTGIAQAAQEEQSPAAAYCIQADLARPGDIRRLVEVALALHGGVDSVIHCAADTRYHGRICELWDNPDAALEQIRINTLIPALLTSALFQMAWKHTPSLNAERNRSVVNISSGSALYISGDHGQGAYSTSKAALNQIGQFLAMELAPYSVRVNTLCPGKFATPAATESVVTAVCALLEAGSTGLIEVPDQR
jgi:NAD(P)-dependent dehydrogenase (short-subunit alcohol dehydrogenase family)